MLNINNCSEDIIRNRLNNKQLTAYRRAKRENEAAQNYYKCVMENLRDPRLQFADKSKLRKQAKKAHTACKKAYSKYVGYCMKYHVPQGMIL